MALGVLDALAEAGLSLKTHVTVGRRVGPAVGNWDAAVWSK